MPFTKPVIDIYGGKASIYLVDPTNIDNTAPHDNPLSSANLPRVIFHSDLPYYVAVQDVSLSWTLPARNPFDLGSGSETINGSALRYFDHTPFGSVTLSAVPRAYVTRDSAYLVDLTTLQQSGSLRQLISARATTSGVQLREHWTQASGQPNWPAVTMSLRGVAFQRVTASGSDLIDFNGSTNTFKFGRLLIDAASVQRLMREASTGIPVTADRSIDFSSGGVRIWNVHTGTYADQGSYGGSYGGPTVRRIQ